MRATEFLNELFQQGKKNWEWKFRGSEEARASFTVGDRTYHWQAFSRKPNSKKWEVQFMMDRKDTDPQYMDIWGTTGTGNSAEVLSTAVDIIREFLQKYGLDKVEEITFNAKEDSRIGLYAKMIKRLLPDWDLYSKKDPSDGMIFTLTDRRAYDKPENKLSENEQLNERATSVVFHYTSTGAALKILQSGNFELASVTGNPSEENYAPKGYPYFLSLTRTPTGDYHRYVGSGGVMFKMNGDWFNSRYIVKPIDYWNSAWLKSDGTRTRESEDRVFSKEPSIPITPVTEIHILLKEQNEYRSPQTRQIMITAKKKDIPAYLYTDEKAWRLLDTRKSVQPSQAKDVLKGQPTKGSTRKPTDFVKPWIELIEKDREEYLSDRATRQLKNLLWYHDTTGDHNIGVDLSNARKPDAGDRASAVKLIKYMNDNGFKNTIELKNAIYDKWNKLKK